MSTDQFFQALESYWMPLPPGIQESFLGQTKEFIAIENRLKEDQSLASYDQQIYPELRTVLGMPSNDESPPPRAVLHFCNNQLQLMENVFLALNLAQYHSHPLNRGWLNLFRRWTAASTVRLLWPSLKSMYSRDFVAFAEYQLNLSGMPPAVKNESEPLSPKLSELFELRDVEEIAKRQEFPIRFKSLFRELEHEWPKVPEENLAPYFKPFSGSNDVWTVSHPQSAAEIWGIALTAPHPGDETLKRLMVWVRPAYRGVGLGKKLLGTMLEKLLRVDNVATMSDEERKNKEGDLKRTLIVLLPPLRRDKPGYADEMAGWLRFYSRKGFVRTTQKDAERILGQTFDPEAFCLVMPELLERFRRPVRQGGSTP